MAIAANTGSATSTAKISDINALITAVNAELATLAGRIKALEDKPAPVIPDITPLATKAELTPLRDFDLALEQRVNDRFAALEAEPDIPDLTVRVEALETAVAAYRTPPVVQASGADPMLSTVPHTPADPTKVELVYDKATIYLGDLELHAMRIAENTWRLVANLNYITINQIQWTYDEIVTGTTDEVYRHAQVRLKELAELKPKHDAVHDRVRRMSEGEP